MPELGRFQSHCVYGLSAVVGAALAVLADLVQKESASALVKISTVANKYLNLSIEPFGWALVLVAFGVAICFVFDPETKIRAFYLGASIIALVMTATPYRAPESAPQGPVEAPASPITLSPAPQANFRLYRADTKGADTFMLTVNLTAQPGGQSSPVLLTIYDSELDRKWQVKGTLLPEKGLTYRWHLKKTGGTRRLSVLVESDKYAFTSAEKLVPPDSESESLTLTLKPTSAPLWYKRLFNVYKY